MGARRDHRQGSRTGMQPVHDDVPAQGGNGKKKPGPSLTEDPLPESVHFGKSIHLF